MMKDFHASGGRESFLWRDGGVGNMYGGREEEGGAEERVLGWRENCGVLGGLAKRV